MLYNYHILSMTRYSEVSMRFEILVKKQKFKNLKPNLQILLISFQLLDEIGYFFFFFGHYLING